MKKIRYIQQPHAQFVDDKIFGNFLDNMKLKGLSSLPNVRRLSVFPLLSTSSNQITS